MAPRQVELTQEERDEAEVISILEKLQLTIQDRTIVDQEAVLRPPQSIDLETASREQRNAWVVSHLLEYTNDHAKPRGFKLLSYYQEDFEGWQTKHFEELNGQIKRSLASFLEDRGLPVRRSRTRPITRILWEYTIQDFDEGATTEARQEIETEITSTASTIQTGDEQRPRRMEARESPVQILLQGQGQNQQTSHVGQQSGPDQSQPTDPLERSNVGPFRAIGSQSETPDTQHRPYTAYPLNGGFSQRHFIQPRPQGYTQQQRRDTRTPRAATSQNTARNDQQKDPWGIDPYWEEWDWQSLPPPVSPMEEIDVSTLQSFSKIWKEKNTWTGAQYDILDSKVKQFLLCSRKLKIRLSQLHTVFDQMLGGEALQYFLNHMNPEQPFATLYMEIRRHYDTEMNRALYHNDWSSLTLNILRGKPEMAGKSSQEVLQALFNKLQLCQRALGEEYQTEQQLVDTTLRAVSGIRELSIALSKPERSFEALCSSLRSALQTAENTNSSTMESFFVDRRFQRATERSKSPFQSSRPFQTNKLSSNGRKWTGKCWCCKKIGCYSKNHTEAEQAKAKEEWKLQRSFENKPKQGYRAYLTAYEGPSPHETFLEEQHSSDPDDLSSEEESEGESS